VGLKVWVLFFAPTTHSKPLAEATAYGYAQNYSKNSQYQSKTEANILMQDSFKPGDVDRFRHYFKTNLLPKYYSPILQAIVIFSSFMLGLIAPLFIDFSFASYFLMMAYHHLFIYVIHRFLLHRPVWGAKWAYRMHIHHHSYFSETRMKNESPEDLYLIFMPYRAVAGYVVYSLPGMLLLFLVLGFSVDIVLSGLLGLALYYGIYEFFHYLSHMSAGHWISHFRWARWMQAFHQNHHHKQYRNHKNFDVAGPALDYIFGTKL
jgi:hypothetical protein